MSADRELIAHLARFCRALRRVEVAVRLSDEVVGAEALGLIDIGDRAEVRRALLVTLRIQPGDRAAFHSMFDSWWSAFPTELPPVDRRNDRPSVHARDLANAPGEESRFRGAAQDAPGAEDGPDGAIGYSPVRLLRRKPFDEWTDADLRAMDRVIARLAIQVATRRSRRLVPTRGRGRIDLRRSLRKTLGTGGELLTFERRTRPIERPRIVLLCDTSGSMDPHTRFLLTFILSLGQVVRRADAFVFNTTLTRITPWLSRRSVHRTLERLAMAVPDWSGGTRIGECLEVFVRRYLPAAIDSKTTVVILSDGLDRGDPAVLARAMRAIQRSARAVIWLNPLLGDPRYEPKARGMAAALPFVDHFAAAHNLESLERIVPLLAA